MSRTERMTRLVDVVLALSLLLLVAPLLVLLVLAIRLLDGGPVLFVQERLGRHGRPFRIHKLRTLAPGASVTVTAVGDPRTTRLGRWLRELHLDELPQLFDVLRGHMALVGPRPEVPANLEAIAPDDLRRVLAVRPGITGPTQLAFLAEDELLAGLPDPVAAYRRTLVPAKVAADLDWLPRRSLVSDLRLLVATPFLVCSRRARERSRERVRDFMADHKHGGAASRPRNGL